MALSCSGIPVLTKNYFDTITLDVKGRADHFLQAALEKGFNLRKLNDDQLCIALDETISSQDVETLWQVFAGDDCALKVAELDLETGLTLPEQL